MSLQYKILGIDLDGTLLSKTKKISKENLEAIKKYTESGGHVVILTGRSFYSTNKIVDTVNSYTHKPIRFVACSKGAYIYDTQAKEPKYALIDDQTVRGILKYCKNKKISLWAYTKKNSENNNVYVTNRFLSLLIRHLTSLNFFKFTKKILHEDLSSFKLNIFSLHRKKIENFLFFLKAKFADKLDITVHEYLIEITPRDINKGFALKYIADILKIKKDNIASIGDSNNDLLMFKESGFNFAINHSELLASEANIVYDKQKNAVAKAIEFILTDK